MRPPAALLAGLAVLAALCLAPAPSVVAAAAAAGGQLGAQRVDAVEVALVAERDAAVPGQPLRLGLRLRHDPHWHTYWRNPGDSGLATQIEPTGPEGTTFGPIRWPLPQRLWVGPLANYGFEGEVLLPFVAQLPASLPAGVARFDVKAQWLVCKDVCIPGEATLALELPVRADGAAVASAHAALFEAMDRRTPDAGHPIAARAHRGGESVALVFEPPAGAPRPLRVEFFPYAEGVISAPAAQRLQETTQGWRLDVALAPGAALPDPLTGALAIDGRPVELLARGAAGAPPEGTVIAVADRPVAAAPGLRGLLGGGAPAATPAGGTAAGAAIPSATAAGAPAGGAELGLLAALLFAALGGAILNLMPCVFPIVGLKVLGFAQAGAGGDGRRAARRQAAAFAAGVVVSFWVLAALLLALRAAGEAVGWGFQLQSPAFVAAMALLFVAVGLNFAGVFEVGIGLTRLQSPASASLSGAFGAGVLAVLVATPCTAPFMGSAIGFTLAQPAAVTLAVFTAVGAGMAAPYLLLGLFPGWVSRLPRPGRWMETLRQALSFPMFATAAWLAWVLVQQTDSGMLLRLLLAAVAVALAAWLWGRFGTLASRRRGLAALGAAASLALGAVLLAPLLDAGAARAPAAGGTPAAAPSAAASDWQPWSAQRVEQALAQGRTVFVDFTAAWCISCQANKQLVLERDPVARALRDERVLALRADWTQRDPAITAELARHGRNGVPLYLVFRPGEPGPRVLPELLTGAIVLDALR
jgi:thiol:disulfide interchange protein DsbD